MWRAAFWTEATGVDQEGKEVSVAEGVREGEKIGKAECGADSLQILEAGIKILCILPNRIFFSAESRRNRN